MGLGRLTLGFLLAIALPVAAAPGAFTDPAAFAANVGGPTARLDFEAFADGFVLSGSTQTPPGAAASIVLPAPVLDVLDPGGPALALRAVADAGDNPASSGTTSLGVDDTGNFHAFTAGTLLSFSFTQPVGAFGLTVITPEEPGGALFDQDVTLSVSGEATASLALADATLLGTFGGREYRAYFVGVVGAGAFSAASLDFGAATPDTGFFFNVDDLVIPVPEPGGELLLLSGCAVLLGLGHRREARRETRP